MRRLGVLLLIVFPLSFLLAGCSKQFPYGKPPDFFFQEKQVLALCSAVLGDDLVAVEQLINDGVDLNLKGKDGITPLLWVLGTKNKALFELFLEAGANPNLQTSKGASVMGYVAAMPDAFFLKTVLKHGGDPNLVNSETLDTPLVEAIMHNQFANMKILLEHGADINYAKPMGHTVMMDAAALNRYDMVHYLLANGANPALATTNGYTIVTRLRKDLQNPHLLRTGELFEAKGDVIDLLDSNGVDVAELRLLYEKTP